MELAETANQASATPDRTSRIRRLNDRLRQTAEGGRLVFTTGLAACQPAELVEILTAVADFDDFTPDNDPHEEHDFGLLTVGNREIMWKIDYYDLTLTYGSDDSANPAVTTRVLTVMLAEEY